MSYSAKSSNPRPQGQGVTIWFRKRTRVRFRVPPPFTQIPTLRAACIPASAASGKETRDARLLGIVCKEWSHCQSNGPAAIWLASGSCVGAGVSHRTLTTPNTSHPIFRQENRRMIRRRVGRSWRCVNDRTAHTPCSSSGSLLRPPAGRRKASRSIRPCVLSLDAPCLEIRTYTHHRVITIDTFLRHLLRNVRSDNSFRINLIPQTSG